MPKTPIKIVTRISNYKNLNVCLFAEPHIFCENTKETIYEGCAGMVAICDTALELAFPDFHEEMAILTISSEPFEGAKKLKIRGTCSIKFSELEDSRDFGLGLAQTSILDYFKLKGYTIGYIGLKSVDSEPV